MWLFFILQNVVAKQGPWYPGDEKCTPNGRPLQINIMTHNSVPKANFTSQTRVNGSPFIAKASSIEEKNKTQEVWSSMEVVATPQQENHMVQRFLFPLGKVIKSFGSTIKLCCFLLHSIFLVPLNPCRTYTMMIELMEYFSTLGNCK